MRLFYLLAMLALSPLSQAFDHTHASWNSLLASHVHLGRSGGASRVDYAALARERAALDAYLGSLSAVSAAEFASYSKPEQQAFLINAYNAQTVALVLQKYPALSSIKDLGSWFKSPWSLTFFKLLGKDQSLDGIEHQMLRAPGRYDDPRVHFAVNCASIGCPALRNEAYVATRLDAQLDEQLRRFVLDTPRNRYSAACDCLEISQIFDWYGEDFTKGHQGYRTVESLFAKFADTLSADPAVRARLRAGTITLTFLDYDWRLNDRLE